jgi:hypothetical protein
MFHTMAPKSVSIPQLDIFMTYRAAILEDTNIAVVVCLVVYLVAALVTVPGIGIEY